MATTLEAWTPAMKQNYCIVYSYDKSLNTSSSEMIDIGFPNNLN